MPKTRKKNSEATLQYFPHPGYPGMPGYPGTPGYTGAPGPTGNIGVALATAYVPPQVFRDMYSLTEALSKGTLFPELYRPYTPAMPMA